MSLLKNKVCNTNKCCRMLVWEIEILNGKKKRVWVFSHKHVLNLWMVLPGCFFFFFKKGNYSNFLPIYHHS